MDLVVGSNTYVTLAEANAYLAASLRASSVWENADDEKKKQALVTMLRAFERQRWLGTKAGLGVVTAGAVAAGGSGYAVDNVLTVVGGTGGAASFKVTSVSSGAVTGLLLLDTGLYSANPSASAAATTVAPSGGTGCTLNLTLGTQILAWPRTGVLDLEGAAISSTTVPQAIEDAQIEAAFELLQDATLETQKNQNSNIRGVKAGSASVDFFRAQDEEGRFPAIVQELLAPYLSGGGAIAPFVSGTDVDSAFEDEDRFDIVG